MIFINQKDNNTVTMKIMGDIPDLICEIAVAYKTVELRGAAMGINVPRLVDLMCDNEYIGKIARQYQQGDPVD